jgi:hypothetical protein
MMEIWVIPIQGYYGHSFLVHMFSRIENSKVIDIF